MTNLTELEMKQLETLTNPEDEVLNEYKWTEDYQRQILGLLLSDQWFLVQSRTLIKPNYFTNDAHKLICKKLFEFFEKYKVRPSKIILSQELADALADRDIKIKEHFQNEFSVILDHYIPGLDTRDALLDKIANFSKVQALKNAFNESLDALKKAPDAEKTWVEIREKLKIALLVERNTDLGLDYFNTLEERYDRMANAIQNGEIFTSGYEPIDNALAAGGTQRGEMYCFVGLCFKNGTKVLMHNGTIKKVEDVVIGDLVMGPDSKPRKVLKLSKGKDELYDVIPVKGQKYTVTKNHILALKNCQKTKPFLLKNGKLYTKPHPFHWNHFSRVNDTDYHISVEDYLKQSDEFKQSMKTFRTGVEFPKQKVKIDPYILGVWLGDGTSRDPEITNTDKEVISAFYKDSISRNLSISKKDNKNKKCGCSSFGNNTFRNDLNYYNLFNNKHIPDCYKINNRENRLLLLAGLLDTDGSYNNCGGFDFINKNKILCKDIVFLARSLGLAAYMKSCKKKCVNNGKIGKYWRISISGDCSVIPLKIKRKKAPVRKQIKNHLVAGIKVKRAGIGEYSGFEVDGDHLFLLNDFTVVHNSGTGKSRCLVATASENIKRDKKVLYVSLEMDEDSIATRFDSLFTNISAKTLIDNRDDAISILKEQVAEKEDNKLLIVKRFPGGTMDVNMLRAYYSQLVLNGFQPDIIIIDYIGEMKDAPGIPVHESRYRIVRDLRGFAVEEKVCVFSALQPNKSGREAQKAGFIDDENLADAFAQIRPLDGCWSINQIQDEKDAGIARLFVIKHRNGKSRFVTWLKYDDDTLRVSSISKETFHAIAKKSQAEKQIRNSDIMGNELDQFREKSKKQLKNDDYEFEEEKPKENKAVSMTGDE